MDGAWGCLLGVGSNSTHDQKELLQVATDQGGRCAGPRYQVFACFFGLSSRCYCYCCYFYNLVPITNDHLLDSLCFKHCVKPPFRFVILFMEVLFCLFLMENLWCGYYYNCPHFKETNTERKISKLVREIIQLGSGRTKVYACLPGSRARASSKALHWPLCRKELSQAHSPGGFGRFRGLMRGGGGRIKVSAPIWGADKCVLLLLRIWSGWGHGDVVGSGHLSGQVVVGKKIQFCVVQRAQDLSKTLVLVLAFPISTCP